MDSMPLITCFMLTYKKFEYIYEALDSILKQSYPRIELAIFDDGSENFPKIAIEEYINRNKRENIENIIIYHSEENQGTVKNFNNVIKHTNGKYLLGAGIDDILYDETVFEKVVDAFERTNASVITCYREVLGRNPKLVPARRNAKRFQNADSVKKYKIIAMGAAIAGAGTYYSRQIFEQLGLFDEDYKLQEDGPFFLKLLRNGYKMQFADIIAVRYRMGYGISSGAELHPALHEDINKMLQKEINPYLDKFNYWEKRRIFYQVERFKFPKKITIKKKIYLCLKYPDVILYRKLMAV